MLFEDTLLLLEASKSIKYKITQNKEKILILLILVSRLIFWNVYRKGLIHG